MELKRLIRANPDRAAGVGLVVAGAIAIVIGWIGISGTGLAAEQIPYLVSGGIGGLVMVVVGCTTWVSADLQDEWRRLDAIDDNLSRLIPGSVDPTLVSAPSAFSNNGSEAADSVELSEA